MHIRQQLAELLADYRRVIVLLADEKTLSAAELQVANSVGQMLFHGNQLRTEAVARDFDTLLASAGSERFTRVSDLLDYIESGPDMFDADRLAFREVLRNLQQSVAKDSALPAIKLHKRIGEDLDAINEIERNYNNEITQIFSRFAPRAIPLKRERWDEYVAFLRKHYRREQILKEYGVIVPYAQPPSGSDEEREIFGRKLPPKTLVLTFDDGPHRAYTEEITAILKQYDVPAVFFEVGRNLGSVQQDGRTQLAPTAKISRRLIDEGYAVGNHSMTHAQLSKQRGAALKTEILDTDKLLQAVDKKRAPLFRFPYGARNAEGLQMLTVAQLKSVMWNIDSLDWADPVPSSIADRVVRTVDKEGRGIILFHDIHERTVKALPLVLDRLIAEGYQFAAWDGREFSLPKAKPGQAMDKTARADAAAGTYRDSWAIVIGIDDYRKWPKLQYAASDANAVGRMLTEKLGFPSANVIVLKNGEATRNNILAAFHDRLAHGGVKKDDRVFIFFAGHGATRKLASGRDLGYIVPADSDPEQFASDAIPMTEIQNIAESLPARHVFFVMDACYSGLGLTRGGGAREKNFLRENAKRIGRQMLTAGGADQMVADGGPNGHSIFTWILLQALSGKADLNGDGIITATELAAYMAPAVAAVAPQTPAFGSLPGSQGGEFVFALSGETEFLTAESGQLSTDAIALNNKLEAAAPAEGGTGKAAKATVTQVIVKDLQGEARKIVVPPPTAGTSARQQAQRANDRGLQLYKEKDYAQAEAQFTEALKLRPDFALAANNLGFVYYKQEKYREAVRWFENTLKMDPSRAVAYLNLGDAYDRLGERQQAEKAYRTYLELSPSGSAADQVRQKLGQAGTGAQQNASGTP